MTVSQGVSRRTRPPTGDEITRTDVDLARAGCAQGAEHRRGVRRELAELRSSLDRELRTQQSGLVADVVASVEPEPYAGVIGDAADATTTTSSTPGAGAAI
jgi:hypothetical protein